MGLYFGARREELPSLLQHIWDKKHDCTLTGGLLSVSERVLALWKCGVFWCLNLIAPFVHDSAVQDHQRQEFDHTDLVSSCTLSEWSLSGPIVKKFVYFNGIEVIVVKRGVV